MPTDLQTILSFKKEQWILRSTDKEIMQIFASIYVIIGLRPNHIPTKEHDLYFISFLRRHFGNRKLKEILFAFELAMLGKLDIDDVRCYDQFTIEYFCKIMQGYRKYFNKIVADTNFVEFNQIDYKMTLEEKHADIKEWMEKKEINIQFIPTYIYDWMDELGYIKLSKDEKLIIYQKAIKFRQSELRKNAEMNGNYKDYNSFSKLLESNFENHNDEKVILRNLAKKIAVFEHINSKK